MSRAARRLARARSTRMRGRAGRWWGVLAAFMFVMAGLHGGGAAAAEPAPSTTIWRPAATTSWQWQLSTPVDLSVDAAVYDIDLFDNDASVVAALHARGRRAICYMSAGSWENWRPDAG